MERQSLRPSPRSKKMPDSRSSQGAAVLLLGAHLFQFLGQDVALWCRRLLVPCIHALLEPRFDLSARPGYTAIFARVRIADLDRLWKLTLLRKALSCRPVQARQLTALRIEH